ncbi:MAG: hypothetical protein ACE5G2_04575 [Candidatus Krumholzibacteriia bacterium]
MKSTGIATRVWIHICVGVLSLLAPTAWAQPDTPIADIQANPQAFLDQVVTVEAQVYVPTNYRGTVFTGYVQDTSGRGINLFGDATNNPLLFDVSNIVRVTGTVSFFFWTVEIIHIAEVTLLSTGNPPLEPQILGTGAAASSDWEGTYIQVVAPIVAKALAGSGINYTVDDGSGPVTVRVVDALGVPQFSIGEGILAAGAGGRFQDDFQVLVGRAEDIFGGVVPVERRSWTDVKTGYRE